MVGAVEEEFPPSKQFIAVCRTGECPVAGIEFEVTLYGPNYACICGRCGQAHSELIEL
ncbi:hypothetical protein QF037_006353 [Streptomyces canus]|nr:hypothetical protein [Streptomyces canus]